MSDVGLALRQTRYSLKGYLRESRAVVFTIVMPIFLLFIFNAIFHGYTRFLDLLVPVSSYYTAAIIAFEIMMASVGWLLVAVTTDRERGFLKRTRGTPCRTGSIWPVRSGRRSLWWRPLLSCWS